MNTRRFVWVLLLAGLTTMLLMWYIQHRLPRGPVERGAGSASSPAATAPSPAAATRATATAPSPAAATRATATAPSPAAATTAPATATAPAPAGGTAPAPASARWDALKFPRKELVLGSLDARSGYLIQVEVISLGAAVKTVKLADYFADVFDKRQHDKDPDGYAAALAGDRAAHPDGAGKFKGHYSLLNPVGVGEKKDYPFATRWAGLPAVGADLDGPVWEAGPVTTDADGAQAVTLAATVTRDEKPCVRIEKTYRLAKGAYSFTVEVKAADVRADKTGPLQVQLLQFGPTGVPRENIQSDDRTLIYGKNKRGELTVEKQAITGLRKAQPGLAHGAELGRSDSADAVLWVGQANRFFAAMAYVLPADPKLLAAPEAKARFFAAADPESPESKTHLTFLKLGPFDLSAADAPAVSMDVFTGPKLDSLFEARPLYKQLQYDKSEDTSWCAFAPLAKLMTRLLNLFSRLFLGNYGLAIMLLVVLVRVALHPLTKKGQVMMARMQKLQPEIAKLREKHAGDKARLNQEMMELYKRQGSHPFLGCLPMLLQMPIWVALWTALRTAVVLRHAAFLPVWITDLAAPDMLVTFSRPLFNMEFPMVGPIVSFNLLPILLGVAMALQQKFSPSSAAPDDQQAKTQKNMMYFMTGFFLLIFYNAPSGLTMYIMTSTFAGVGEQYIIRKHLREKDAAEAAAETQVAVPGKHFRGQKPKKPKGPFKF